MVGIEELKAAAALARESFDEGFRSRLMIEPTGVRISVEKEDRHGELLVTWVALEQSATPLLPLALGELKFSVAD